MRARTRLGAAVVGVTAFAMVAAGCGGSSNNSGSKAKTSDATITIDNVEPENPLIPGNTNETGGSKVIKALFTGLLTYNPDTAAPENAMADSITTSDSKVYTVKIKSGWKFHDGTDVKAKNFVDAWNWVAYSPNGALNASFLSHIAGFSDVNTTDPDEDGPLQAPKPKTDKLSGLKIIDDTTFEITLDAPFAVFKTIVGYDVFDPLPDVFFKDTKAFGQHPIGNGPFKFVKWDHKQQIQITRNDDYKGNLPKVKNITMKIYQSQDSAYADLLSNNLDYQQQVPTAALAGDKWKSDLGTRAIDRPIGAIQTITFPMYDSKFKNMNPKVRQAISLAIDRKSITDKIFNKSREPANGWVSPAVDGYKADACGDLCTFDATRAKQLLQEGGGFTGDLSIAYNADGDHKAWTEATCNSITNNLGVKCTAKPYVDFATFRKAINAHKMDNIFRTGWVLDYPSIEDFLNPLYKTGGASNDGLYSNAALDAALTKADQAPSQDEANKLYQDAEAMLAQDMSVIPLWYYKQQSGYSTKVKNVKVDPFGELVLDQIEPA
jgi:oligopeptide transport system substrate-binding protein